MLNKYIGQQDKNTMDSCMPNISKVPFYLVDLRQESVDDADSVWWFLAI